MNVQHGMNDRQIQAVFEHYDLIRVLREHDLLTQCERREIHQIASPVDREIRYWNYVRKAWRHAVAEECDEMVTMLYQSQEYASYSSREDILFSWAALFGEWSADEGVSEEALLKIWPYFEHALAYETSEQWMCIERLLPWWTRKGYVFLYYDLWELHFWRRALQKALPYEPVLDIPAEEILSWWSELWYQYWGKEHTSLPECPLGKMMHPDLYLELLQHLLAVSHTPVPPAEVARLWQDLLTQGRIPTSFRYRITALYLTVFGQAVIKHWDWRIGREALAAALKLSWHSWALQAWGRFLRNTASYIFSKNHLHH